MREDKKLRKQQEEEYWKACQKKEEAPKPQPPPQSQPQSQPNRGQPSLFQVPGKQEVKPEPQGQSP